MDFDSALAFVNNNSYSYVFILIGMFFWGPVVIPATAFAASLGFFNIYFVFFLALLGNIIPDIFLFSAGALGRKFTIKYYGKRFGVEKKRLRSLAKHFKKHAGKTLVAVKLTPMMPVPGIIMAGYIKVPFKRFLKIDMFFNLGLSISYVVIGFYFGKGFEVVSKYMGKGSAIVVFIIISVVMMPVLYKYLSKTIAGKIDKI